MLERLIRSKACVKALGVVLFQDGLHLREIARQAGISPYEARRELAILTETGILRKERRGNQLIFSRDEGCAFIEDLKNLYNKTEGVFAGLKEALGSCDGVDYALIFGSSATGEEKPRSDIDLLVVGSVPEGVLSEKVFAVQRRTGREINFILWKESTLAEKAANKSPFLKSILRKGFIPLIGDRDGFVRAASKGPRAKDRGRP